VDPPYNLSKSFNGRNFSRRPVRDYTDWLENVCALLRPLLKQSASVYFCGDWFTSVSIFAAASKYFEVRNRITWEREKGRGAKLNWKNSSEDIWFCTVSDKYTFNLDAVRLRRRVIAPYTHQNGAPKDWVRNESGGYRDTCPSNIWSDITVPFWSMHENTDHPTQKSEKLVAKLILASSNPGDVVLDPFAGSGTTAVVSKKLGRRHCAVEQDMDYCLLAAKRLELAERDRGIQGIVDGVFWERNSKASATTASDGGLDFDSVSIE
jgi:site-specific DNA-methyltransferase (adenine-specific)